MNDSILAEPNRFDYTAIPELANHQDRLKCLRTEPHAAQAASSLLHLIESRSTILLLEREPLLDLLLLRVTGFLAPTEVVVRRDGWTPKLFDKLSNAYRTVQEYFRAPNGCHIPPCALPEFLDDVFMAYATLNPRWYDGPGAGSPLYEGDARIKVMPRHLVRDFFARTESPTPGELEALKTVDWYREAIQRLRDDPHTAQNAGPVLDLAERNLEGECPDEARSIIDNLENLRLRSQTLTEALQQDAQPIEIHRGPSVEVPNESVLHSFSVEQITKHLNNRLNENWKDPTAPMVIVEIPKGSKDTIDSVGSRKVEGTRGIFEFLVNNEPGRLMVDMTQYPPTEAHEMYHDFRKAWGAYWDARVAKESKLGRSEE